jgi:histidinol-phosphate aminotransferase
MARVVGIEGLIKPEIIALGGYVASKAPETLKGQMEVPVEDIIKLDANENLYGCSPRVQQALASFPYLNIYPDAGQEELRRLLSEYVGVEPERIVAGNGSDELIGYVFRAFVGRDDEVINCVPTFDIFRHRTQLCGGTLVEITRDEDFNVDVDVVKAAITERTKMIPLATPNNPTGTLMPQEDILDIVETGVPVLVDEAYTEFSGETVTQLVSKYDNMMVLRTFSKWAGLAGMRIGYGIFPPRIAAYLMKIKEPYNVNAAAVVAVRESFRDLDYLQNNVKAIVSERERLFTELKKLKFLKPFPSQANFIFCSVLNGNASQIQQKLEQKGLLVRYFDIPLLRNALRIGVGKPEHTDALLKALREIGEELND